ncbi:MAG: hypothetical protein IPP90_09480 [Gemmatimonadaceae bacterium]|nr:hypothetical protein [Gemmatimonadaceae bacterium]
MKGGKGGQGRKRSNVRVAGKGKVRGGGKKHTAHRDHGATMKKEAKTTTRLGANRVPDDA